MVPEISMPGFFFLLICPTQGIKKHEILLHFCSADGIPLNGKKKKRSECRNLTIV